jgi:hypothetical protein
VPEDNDVVLGKVLAMLPIAEGSVLVTTPSRYLCPNIFFQIERHKLPHLLLD